MVSNLLINITYKKRRMLTSSVLNKVIKDIYKTIHCRKKQKADKLYINYIVS